MEKIIEWIQKHKKISFILIVTVVFLPIIVIHVLFKIKTNCFWIIAEWEAGDILGYFGDVLSFVGTIALSYVAICQTEKANALSAQLLELEWKQRQPCLCIDGSQEYKIYSTDEEINDIKKEYGFKDLKIKPYYINDKNRTGITQTIAVIVLSLKNTGGSDIRNLFIKSNYCFLSAKYPDGYNECVIYGIEGDTSIKQGERKRLFIEFVQELDIERENFDFNKAKEWVESNKLMRPGFDFDIYITTVDGFQYMENLVCSTSISNINYIENKVREVKRYLSVIDMHIEKCE